MQIPKEEIKQNILSAAKEEFLKNGFEKASVRTITANAKTSKSNVYNYFKDKDALFYAVVETTLLGIKEGLKKIKDGNTHKNEPYSIAAQKEVIRVVINYVFANSEDFKLLLFYSAGSSLSGFKNNVIEQLATVLMDWIRITAPKNEVSELLIHSVAGFYVGAIERLLWEEKAKEQASGYLNEFLKFIYGGWNAIL